MNTYKEKLSILSVSARRIKSLREKRNISKSQLAKEIGVTLKTITSWENNTVLPKIKYVIKLTKYFETSTDYLLGLTDI